MRVPPVMTALLWAMVGGVHAQMAYALSPKDGSVYKPVVVTPHAERTWDVIQGGAFPFVVVFVVLVAVCILYISWRFHNSRHPTPSVTAGNTFMQTVWFAVPLGAVALLAPAIVALLGNPTPTVKPQLTITITGLADGWRYDYGGENVAFVSRGIHENHLKPGQRRLMSTDTPLILPESTPIRLQFTSASGAKRWVVPELGINAHLRVGRTKSTALYTEEPGNYYGFCGISCGKNHLAMPIEVRIIPRREFASWIDVARANQAEK